MIIKSYDHITMKERTLTNDLEVDSVSLSRRSISLSNYYDGSLKTYKLIFSSVEEMEVFAENLYEKIVNHEKFT